MHEAFRQWGEADAIEERKGASCMYDRWTTCQCRYRYRRCGIVFTNEMHWLGRYDIYSTIQEKGPYKKRERKEYAHDARPPGTRCYPKKRPSFPFSVPYRAMQWENQKRKKCEQEQKRRKEAERTNGRTRGQRMLKSNIKDSFWGERSKSRPETTLQSSVCVVANGRCGARQGLPLSGPLLSPRQPS
jgi:hypothetical protein